MQAGASSLKTRLEDGRRLQQLKSPGTVRRKDALRPQKAWHGPGQRIDILSRVARRSRARQSAEATDAHNGWFPG